MQVVQYTLQQKQFKLDSVLEEISVVVPDATSSLDLMLEEESQQVQRTLRLVIMLLVMEQTFTILSQSVVALQRKVWEAVVESQLVVVLLKVPPQILLQLVVTRDVRQQVQTAFLLDLMLD